MQSACTIVHIANIVKLLPLLLQSTGDTPLIRYLDGFVSRIYACHIASFATMHLPLLSPGSHFIMQMQLDGCVRSNVFFLHLTSLTCHMYSAVTFVVWTASFRQYVYMMEDQYIIIVYGIKCVICANEYWIWN